MSLFFFHKADYAKGIKSSCFRIDGSSAVVVVFQYVLRVLRVLYPEAANNVKWICRLFRRRRHCELRITFYGLRIQASIGGIT